MAKKESKRISCKSMHGIQKIMKDTVADLYTPGASSRTLQKKCLNLQKKQSNGFLFSGRSALAAEQRRACSFPSARHRRASYDQKQQDKERDVQNKGAYG